MAADNAGWEVVGGVYVDQVAGVAAWQQYCSLPNFVVMRAWNAAAAAAAAAARYPKTGLLGAGLKPKPGIHGTIT